LYYINSPTRVAGLCALLYLLLTFWHLHPQYDITTFICAGDYFTKAGKTPSEIHILENSYGYDGQAFYRLALDPFTSVQTDFGVTLDHPSFRQQRIGYPAVVWALSLGQAALVPYMLVLVNFIAAVALGWLGASVARHFGQYAWLGIVFALYPGFAVSYTRDLAEILTAAWLLAGILSVLRGRHLAAALLMAAAVATRETALLVPAAVGLVLLLRYIDGRDLRASPWPLYLLPLVAYLAINTWMWISWGQLSLTGGVGNLGPPLVGITHFVQENWHLQSIWQKMNMATFGVCIGVLFIGAASMRKSQAGMEWKLGWLFYALMMLSLTTVIWLGYGEFMRAFTELWILTCVLVLASTLRWKHAAASAVILGWTGFSLVLRML